MAMELNGASYELTGAVVHNLELDAGDHNSTVVRCGSASEPKAWIHCSDLSVACWTETQMLHMATGGVTVRCPVGVRLRCTDRLADILHG